MICVEDQYFNVNRILLIASGVWPYQQSKFARLQFIIFSGILLEAIISQLTVFLTSRCTTDLVIMVLSNTFFYSFITIKYISFGNNTKAIKDLLAQLQHIYNKLKDENENAIVEKYGYDAKRYTVAITMFAVCSLSIFVTIQYWTKILDIITPLNESRTHRLPIMAEHFIDQEKYFYFILLYINVVFCIVIVALTGTGTILIACFHHICGLFRIASYRIKHSIKTDMLQTISTKNEKLISERIIYAVDIHRQAMKLSVILVSRLETMLFFLIMFVVTSLSLNMFRICQIASIGDNAMELLLPLVCVIILVLYMFIANYLGQNITDHSNHVFATAYNIQWYTAPLHIQRLILFLLQKGTKEFTLNVGGLFVASLKCFATLLNTSISYFTVIYSAR